jgi:endonuclease III
MRSRCNNANRRTWARDVLNRLRQEYPQAGTSLEFSSLFELLVAVMLSAQSTDAQVNRVSRELFKRYNTPLQLAALELTELEALIRGVGLYKNKARNIKSISQILLDKYQGQIPADMDSLLTLPGIGRKSANVVLSVGFDQPGLGVDTHVHRVSNRVGLVKAKNPHETEAQLKAVIPREDWSLAHHLFIFHGRQVCRARSPRCDDCAIAPLCERIGVK